MKEILSKEKKEGKGFEYNYSAKQQKEIEAIKRKYMQKPINVQEDKMETLRRLDRNTEKTGTIWGLVLGIVGILVFGTGMSMVLVWTDTLLFAGILVCLPGLFFIVIAYPVYKSLTKRARAKAAPQILALTEELMKGNE